MFLLVSLSAYPQEKLFYEYTDSAKLVQAYNMGFAAILAEVSIFILLFSITAVSVDLINSALVLIFIIVNSFGLLFPADSYKIPAQQKALNVLCHFIRPL